MLKHRSCCKLVTIIYANVSEHEVVNIVKASLRALMVFMGAAISRRGEGAMFNALGTKKK